MDEKILALPWQIQVALGSGYAAYLIAYAGMREHHKATEIAFRAIAFGLVATFLMMVTDNWPKWQSLPLAFAFTVFFGAAWRRFGIKLTERVMRGADISWADDTPNAWASLTVCNSDHPISQISVQLDDGSWLKCLDTRKFADSPFGPVTMGSNGDIALYVTHEQSTWGIQSETSDIVVDYYGSRLTYVPAAKVKRVAIRYA